MVDIKGLVNRCKEIIDEGNKILDSPENYPSEIPKVNTSIESIYQICYPKGIPIYLALDHLTDTIEDQGFPLHSLGVKGIFFIRLKTFIGFVENLEKGLITSDLMSVISLDIYNDMIEQAQELRRFNTEPLNRAACLLARIVLEDGLKKLCSKHGINLKSDKANEANIELKKKSIYGNSQFKHVDTWLSIGNAAAHPQSAKLNFSSITETQMDDMIKNIPEFLGNFL